MRSSERELYEQVLSDIARDVRATKAAVLFGSEDSFFIAAHHDVDERDVRARLETQDSATAPEAEAADSIFKVALPLVDPMNDEPIGWLLVGPRPDGTSCNRDERNALASVAAPIARSLAAVQAREIGEGRLLAGLAVLVSNSRSATPVLRGRSRRCRRMQGLKVSWKSPRLAETPQPN
ncbi:MAG: hypothetical protein HY243_00500 [Proteobacteria bacterium]|nr:hypothetical protein [Pseudomonadota bacterium]